MPKKRFNDHPFRYRHELELEIVTLTNLGLGLGRVALDSGGATPTSSPRSEGWVVMVPFTLPGERVRARVYRNHRNYSEADLLDILVPSPDRVAAPCPLFGRCGGCQYQHLAYPRQLVWKQRQVEELLRHLAGVDHPVEPTVPSPREYGYRSKITPHFSAPKHRKLPAGSADEKVSDAPPPAVGVPIGFLKQGSRFEIVDVPACPIATPEINAKLTEVRAEVRQRITAGEYDRGATLLLRHAQEGVVTDYDSVIHERVDVAPAGNDPGLPEQAQPAVLPPQNAGGASVSKTAAPATRAEQPTLSPGAEKTLAEARTAPSGASPAPLSLRLHFLARDFFQNNPFILPEFVGYVRRRARSTGARFLVDAYCGSGLFALACASAFERVAGIEISESSVRFATENAAANGVGNAQFHAGDASRIFAGLGFPPADTVVIIDPPRRGCDESFLAQLFAFAPRAVVYVSCDPATQMRDLKAFLACGYALTSVQPFDLFPQTRHLECVMTLVRSRGAPE